MATAANAQCCPGHDKHMCQLVEKKTPADELKKLIKGAKFMCGKCGRAAADKAHLCAPVEL